LQTSPGHLGRLTSDSVQFVADTGPANSRSSLGLLVDGSGALRGIYDSDELGLDEAFWRARRVVEEARGN